jgi:hypothetical protein
MPQTYLVSSSHRHGSLIVSAEPPIAFPAASCARHQSHAGGGKRHAYRADGRRVG